MARRVLVCEDDAILAIDVCAQLTADGHCVVGPVSDALSALDMAERHNLEAAIIDLNLSDGRSGLAIAREMHGRGIPVILCSGDVIAPAELKDIKHIFVSKPLSEGLLSFCLASIPQDAPERAMGNASRGEGTIGTSASSVAVCVE
jgi:CheY-like chemotaxis protein